MIKWDIAKRPDLTGLPTQIYIEYKRVDGEDRQLAVHLDTTPYKSVPEWVASMHAVLDAVEVAYKRDHQRAFGWSCG